MAIVAIRLLDRTGRRPLLLGGTTGMAAGMIVVALTFAIGGSELHRAPPTSRSSACCSTPDRSPSGWARCSGC